MKKLKQFIKLIISITYLTVILQWCEDASGIVCNTFLMSNFVAREGVYVHFIISSVRVVAVPYFNLTLPYF